MTITKIKERIFEIDQLLFPLQEEKAQLEKQLPNNNKTKTQIIMLISRYLWVEIMMKWPAAISSGNAPNYWNCLYSNGASGWEVGRIETVMDNYNSNCYAGRYAYMNYNRFTYFGKSHVHGTTHVRTDNLLSEFRPVIVYDD